jgi:hypothetical protein
VVRRFLDHDRGDDEDLGGKRDDAGPRAFDETHGLFLF